MSLPKTCNITPEEYQSRIVEFYRVYQNALSAYSHGLLEECGEVAGLFRRHYRGHNLPFLREDLIHELGDILEYLVLIADVFNIDLEAIMQTSMEKITEQER